MSQVAADPTKPSPQREIRSLLHLLRLQTKVSTHQSTFSNVLSLHCERLHAPSFCFSPSPDQLTFRYTIQSSLLVTSLDATTTLSTYAALLEEVTNWVLWATKTAPPLFSGRKRPRQYRQTQVNITWGPAAEMGLYPGSVVDIVATIKRKDSNVVFIDTEIRDKEFGGVVCQGTCSREIPRASGGKVKFLMTSWFNNLFVPVPPMPLQYNMCQLFNALDFQTQTSAFFTASPEHCSTCGQYPLHEGCQIILMELFGRQIAMSEMATPMAHLQSIQDLCYMSAPSIKVELVAVVHRPRVSSRKQRTVTMTVAVRRMDGTEISRARLVYCDSLEAMILPNYTTSSDQQNRHLQARRAPSLSSSNFSPAASSTFSVSQIAEQRDSSASANHMIPSGFFQRR
jgi:hypothetical protein